MFIKSVFLKNIKSYREATIDFQWGTNAISGENGAGKSTILEAIGYALFDYRPYKIENMVRHGQKKGEIRVVFTGKDERDYEIVRTIRKKGGTASYYIHDLRLGGNIADSKHHGKEGVLTAVRKDILDIAPGTGLQTIFEDVIGVPQGTIIAPFLETPAQRKEKFDPILGIDEYKRAYDKSGEIARIIEKKRNGLENENASVSGKLEGHSDTLREQDRVRAEIKKIARNIEKKSRELKDVEQRKSGLEEIEKKIRAGESRLRELAVGEKEAGKREKELGTALKNAQQAGTIVRASEPHYLAYQDLEKKLRELETARLERDKIMKEKQILLRREAGLKERLSLLEEELKRSTREMEKLPELEKKLEMQKEMESRKQKLENALLVKKERATRLGKLEGDLKKSRDARKGLQDRLKAKDDLEKKVQAKNDLDRKLEELKAGEVTLKTRIEHYRKSRENLKTGSCPFFDEPCPKITGDAAALFQDEEKELGKKLKRIWGEIASVNSGINDSRKAEEGLQKLQILVGREKALGETISGITDEIETLRNQVAKGSEEEELKSLRLDIEKTGDHRGEYLRLMKSRERRPGLEQEFSGKQLSLTQLGSSLKAVGERLESYSGLEEARKECESQKKSHRKGYEDYRSYKKESEKEDEISERLAKVSEGIAALEKESREVSENIERSKRTFSREELEGLTRSFKELNQELGSLKGTSGELVRRGQQLTREIKKMEALKKKQAALEKRLEVESFSERLMAHIRDVLKRTPGYLRKRYVAAISQDANNRFHELMGDNSVDISWSEEYGISMRKGRDTIEFKLLSGGQQMSAALAIRLALIRRFSGLKIAFFDEPTHNLDNERKDNLARAFYRITGFDQLFVISHDETFNTVIENTIGIRMVNGESVVEG